MSRGLPSNRHHEYRALSSTPHPGQSNAPHNPKYLAHYCPIPVEHLPDSIADGFRPAWSRLCPVARVAALSNHFVRLLHPRDDSE